MKLPHPKAAARPGDAETRVFKHALGETVIPARPERVVTLQYVSQMLSVGVKPIGALDYLLDGKDPAFQGIEEVGSSESVDYEKILSLKPP
ncbi:iron complex transport system substrate-binding protein [Paenibacillus sp. UNC496MF]|uniref:ABC transporter substrate-binding protein n=1 Tax=Paenibacillus sp. UNC496MF TaxID=1502753 RepID=UPI0008E488EC|nr:ABC transporter substrate-binding protein [Paenibacillus sp. UNC496MF]SFJ73767.1 iron complex transport system substrate-binding protein [Paenibacillus sp. UNC496MF]